MSTYYVEVFKTEEEVLQKIEELKTHGYVEEDMYVMSRHEDELLLLKGRTDVELESSEGNWMDKFKAFVTGDSAVREAFNRMGMEREDAKRYYDDVHAGAILLYADNKFGETFESNPNYIDENIDSRGPHEENHTITGTNFTKENTHTEPGSDNGKNLNPSKADREKFGTSKHGDISSVAVDAGTPDSLVKQSLDETSTDENKNQIDYDKETEWVERDKMSDNSRLVKAKKDDKGRLFGGQPQSDDNPNQHKHRSDPRKLNYDTDKVRDRKADEQRKITEKERVLENQPKSKFW